MAPYEDSTTFVANIYATTYDESALICGSENEIGDATSNNLGIVGFNNNLTGYKMLVVGQGNEITGTQTNFVNTASLVVGTTNTVNKTSPNTGTIINTVLSGQNNNITHKIVRSIIGGISHTTDGDAANALVAGSNNKLDGNNNVMWGANNVISNVNTVSIGGFSNTIKKSGSNSNSYGTLIYGYSNDFGSATDTVMGFANLIGGRDNDIDAGVNYITVGGRQNFVGSGRF